MTMSILEKLQAKKVAAASATWSLQVPPELSARLDALARRMSVHRTEIIRLLVDQGIDDLNQALDESIAATPPAPEETALPDLTPTPQYDEAGIATEY